jgi:hypothetical protein
MPRICSIAAPAAWDGRVAALSAYELAVARVSESGNAVIRVVRHYDAPATAVRWSPHDGGALLAVARDDGVEVLDTRCPCKPAVTVDAHSPIAEWSPFGPH